MNANQNSYFADYGDFRMPQWLLKMNISTGAKLTYSVLRTCSSGRDYAWPSQEYLSEKVSVSVRTLQRYLNELVRSGLIEKAKQYIKGQVRNIYRFLLDCVAALKGQTQDVVEKAPPRQLEKHNILGSVRHDKLSPCTSEAQKNLPTDTTNRTDQCDKLSSSLNKVETIKGINNIPPTPQTVDSVAQGEVDRTATGNGGAFSLESKKEDSDWIEALKTLEVDLKPHDFLTWISPLRFEKNGSEAILSAPNPFFLNWVKNHFSQNLQKALTAVGLNKWRLELMTDEQCKALEEIDSKRKSEEKKSEPVKPEPEDPDALPLVEQYQRLYQAYPRNYECRERGWQIFLQLHRNNQLPRTSELIKAVKRAKSNNQSWQRDNGRYIPQIHNWLSDQRWKD